MKLITRDTDYAVRILSAVANKKSSSARAAELSKELDIPLSYVRKILQMLAKKGPLKSYKGKGGGFTLSLDPKQILIIDIINIFQGPLSLGECLFKKRICHNQAECALRKIILDIEDTVKNKLNNVTLASLQNK